MNLNLELLEESNKFRYENLHKDARDYLFSQFKKTVATLGKILIDYGKQKEAGIH